MPWSHLIKSQRHRPLKIRTDGVRPRVRELGSIGVLELFSAILSKVVCLLQNLVNMMPQTTLTNVANLVTV